MFNVIPLATYAVQAVAGAGVSKVAKDIVMKNVVTDTKAQKAMAYVGIGAITAVVSNATKDNVGQQLTELQEAVDVMRVKHQDKKAKKEAKKAAKEAEKKNN